VHFSTNFASPMLIFCYKIVFGMVAISFSDIFEFSHVNKTRGHAYKLFKSHSNNSTLYRFFAERVVSVWNSLPASVNFSTLGSFRRFRDFSLPGTFAPLSESSHWELSLPGAKVPRNIRSADRYTGDWGANCTSNFSLHITHELKTVFTV